MLGIPNLNLVYEDAWCSIFIHDVYADHDNHDLLVVHVDVIKTGKKSVLAHYLEAIDGVFDALREKGRTEVEAWVCTDEEIRFAQFFGFDEFIGELTVNKQTCLPSVFRLKKDLT